MSIVKQAAIVALADHFKGVFGPEMPDIYANAVDPDKGDCFPSLVISSIGPFSFEPFDPDELDTTPSTVTIHLGYWTGKFQLQLGAKSAKLRAELGDRILTEFYKSPGRSGVLVLQLTGFEVGGIPFAPQLPIGYQLGQDSWEDEMVFERKRYENLDVEVEIPALVTWNNTYDINTLVLSFTNDLTTDVADLDKEQVQVTDTGDLEEYP